MAEPHRAFFPDTPVCWSISGGLTSGLMLHERLRHGPQREGEFFVFANTGKEREETLVFLHEIEQRWGVDLVWLQRTPGGGIERVTFETAARDGEPFTQLINERGYLPNPVTRFCTVELKLRTIGKFCSFMGLRERSQALGLRADEMHRVVRVRGRIREAGVEEAICPLADASVTLEHVESFWAAQPFTLNLKRYEGNCDLCFLKGQQKILRVLRDAPERADWWRERERERERVTPRLVETWRCRNCAWPGCDDPKIMVSEHDIWAGIDFPLTEDRDALCTGPELYIHHREVLRDGPRVAEGALFRKDRPSYTRLQQFARNQPLLPIVDEEACDDLSECACTD